MNYKTKRKIRNKANLLNGLLKVLRDDVDVLISDSNKCDIGKLTASIQDTLDTSEKVIDVISKLEYILYLESTRER